MGEPDGFVNWKVEEGGALAEKANCKIDGSLSGCCFVGDAAEHFQIRFP